MKKPHWAWKAAVIIFAALAAFDLVYRVAHRDLKPAHLTTSFCLVLASVGSVQFAFGLPRFPRLFWRIFGPPSACVVAWVAAWAIGWLATRLAIRPLTGLEQLWTLASLVLFVTYGSVVVLPLCRLGEWQQSGSLGQKRPGG